MTLFATALAVLLAAQQPTPPVDFTLPGQVTPPPVNIPADAEVLPFQSGLVVSRPSAAARHFLLAPAPRIPARGIAFTIRCLLDRSTGRVLLCQDPTVPEAWKAAARGLASLYQFQLTPAQVAAQGPLAVAIQDRIAPSDVRPAARLFQFSQRPPGSVTFAQVMTAEQSQNYYPRGALQMELDARIRVDCQVQTDLSLFCLNPQAAPGSNPGRFLGDFELAALQLTGWFRAAPTLSNGGTAPGTIFRTTIIFRVPE